MGVSYQSVKYERPTRVSSGKCQVRVAFKSVKKTCQGRLSHASVKSEWLAKASSKKCQRRGTYKGVKKECQVRVSSQSVLQKRRVRSVK